jgi:hypothetical protein
LPIPDVVAYPLAWLTTRVYLRPRGHRVVDISATEALRRIQVPILLVHGSDDDVIPVNHLARLRAATTGFAAPIESLVIDGGRHSWLYESPIYRRTVAAFLARTLGGPVAPEVAAALAEAVDAKRLPDGVRPPTQIEREPGGFRSLVGLLGARDVDARSGDVVEPDPLVTEIAG